MFESANEHSTKSACRKRMCWYATRRGQRSVNTLVCAVLAGSAKRTEERLERGEDVGGGEGEGSRMKSIS